MYGTQIARGCVAWPPKPRGRRGQVAAVRRGHGRRGDAGSPFRAPKCRNFLPWPAAQGDPYKAAPDYSEEGVRPIGRPNGGFSPPTRAREKKTTRPKHDRLAGIPDFVSSIRAWKRCRLGSEPGTKSTGPKTLKPGHVPFGQRTRPPPSKTCRCGGSLQTASFDPAFFFFRAQP